jgi:CheY-like chemotaxis protein
MKPRAGLILGADSDKSLHECLFGLGLAPIGRETMQSALDKLRHERFELVLIDRQSARVDVLELVLNVRDLDRNIPIVVVGRSHDPAEERSLRSQKHVFVIEQPGDREALVRTVERLGGLTEPACE